MHAPSPNSTEALDPCLLVAGIEEFDVGFTAFDASLKLVVANARFLEMLDFPQALSTPGHHFQPLCTTTTNAVNMARLLPMHPAKLRGN